MSDSTGIPKTPSPFDEPECPGCGRRLVHGDIHPFPPCEWRRERNRIEEDLRDAQEASWQATWNPTPGGGQDCGPEWEKHWSAYQEKVVDNSIVLCALIIMRALIRQSHYSPELQADLIVRIQRLINTYKESNHDGT